jgi:hypothetical protein
LAESQPDFDLGRLLRLQETIQAAAGSDEPGGLAAPVLTSSYKRLRGEVKNLISESPLVDEFERTFPEIDVVELPNEPNAQNRFVLENAGGPLAQTAHALLQQLGGWIAGLVAERTLQARIEAEAIERVKREQRPPTGFG